MVFSTLHTNDAPSAFTRLMNMGVEPFLISSSLLGVLAQRLLRRVCDKCKEQYVPSDDVLRSLGMDDRIGKGIKFTRGKGCRVCSQSGYKGRTGIYELLKVTPEIQEAVLQKKSADDIRAVAVSQGLVTLRSAALEKLENGSTTPEEVVRVTLESAG